MLNLSATLDNLIAMVVVLLALSLVVQAVQSSVKKMFKLKSRQIEDSLAHLFKFVVNDEEATRQATGTKSSTAREANASAAAAADPTKPDSAPAITPAAKWNGIAGIIYQSPFLRMVFRRGHPAMQGIPEAAALYDEVMGKFRAVGRTALSTRPIFDSLSKSDLLNVVASVTPEKIDTAFQDKFEKAKKLFDDLEAKYLAWESVVSQFKPGGAAANLLSADDMIRLDAVRAKLQPLVDDLRMLLRGQGGGANALGTLVRDIAKLREINLDDVQKTLSDVRARVALAVTNATTANNPQAATLLGTLEKELGAVSNLIADFRQRLDAVFANLVKLEGYFDTVMQSFEERYTRSMKTAALVISFLVVVFLNADFFKVYRQISTSDATRELVMQSRQNVLDAVAKSQQLSAADDAKVNATVQAWFEASKKQVQDSASTFEGYGFQPITLADTKGWFNSLSPKNPDWGGQRKRDLKTLLGWLVMTLLLSVGAPFWQDFLESLFGVKNVLRKRSETQNVEQKPGAGQTKQA